MTAQEAQLLLQRYLDGECTPAEKMLVESWWDELHDEYPWDIPAGDREMVKARICRNGTLVLYNIMEFRRLR